MRALKIIYGDGRATVLRARYWTRRLSVVRFFLPEGKVLELPAEDMLMIDDLGSDREPWWDRLSSDYDLLGQNVKD